MLINATQSEEIRVALVKNNHLIDLDIDCPSDIKKKGNIYKAVVTRREPSLDAVFVEYGSNRQGFLPFKEISSEYFNKRFSETDEERPPITALIREGQELLVQVDKEERGNKGAALTTFITLAGYYLVLMPNNPHSGGISRRIEGDARDELKETLNALQLPENMGLIIRTAGLGKSQEELQNDLDMLCNQWQAIRQAYANQLAPCLIHQEGDVIIRSIRDNLRKSIAEIIIDDSISYVKAKQYIEQVKPDFLPNVKLYNSNIPLFNFYQIENQIESAYKREVPLPSGGSLVIDRTEALVSIDVNSAKATSGTDIETTALNTNIEASYEIARQLRLRDLGGLVVIDFIDMSSTKNQRQVENLLKEALEADRARIQVGRISRFGLLEMSRQRLRLSLGESAQEVCPRCEGRGTVRNIPSYSLSIIRLIEEEALKDKIAEIQVQLPVEIATFIMNEKRDFILHIEKRHDVQIVIIANPYLHAPQYTITRLREDNVGKNKKASFSLIQQPEITVIRDEQETVKLDEPIVKDYSNGTGSETQQISLIKRLWKNIFGSEEKPDETLTSTTRKHKSGHPKEPGVASSDQYHYTTGKRHPGSRKRRSSPQHRSTGNHPASAQHQQRRRNPSQQHSSSYQHHNRNNPARKKEAANQENEE